MKAEQIEIIGNHHVNAAAVLEKFAADQYHSVISVPLDSRRAALEEIPWVEKASVARLMPNKLRVEIVERTPVAFLRQGGELALIDAYGMVLERPQQADYNFPVVTGIAEAGPREDRQRRMDHRPERQIRDVRTAGVQEVAVDQSQPPDPVVSEVADRVRHDANPLRRRRADGHDGGNAAPRALVAPEQVR